MQNGKTDLPSRQLVFMFPNMNIQILYGMKRYKVKIYELSKFKIVLNLLLSPTVTQKICYIYLRKQLKC